VEVPIIFRDRLRGESKMSPRIAIEAMWLVPRLRFGRQPVTPAAQALPPSDVPVGPGS
jgi:hypothetical protein